MSEKNTETAIEKKIIKEDKLIEKTINKFVESGFDINNGIIYRAGDIYPKKTIEIVTEIKEIEG